MAKKRTDRGEFGINLTPMIDVTFQLIIFFIIAGQMASEELAKLIAPQPEHSMANEKYNKAGQLIVNIVSRAEDDPDAAAHLAREAKYWIVSGVPEPIDVGDLETLTRILTSRLVGLSDKDREKFTIEVRSDYRVTYGAVETVLIAAAKAGIPNMNITALVDPGRASRTGT